MDTVIDTWFFPSPRPPKRCYKNLPNWRGFFGGVFVWLVGFFPFHSDCKSWNCGKNVGFYLFLQRFVEVSYQKLSKDFSPILVLCLGRQFLCQILCSKITRCKAPSLLCFDMNSELWHFWSYSKKLWTVYENWAKTSFDIFMLIRDFVVSLLWSYKPLQQ